MISGTTRRDRSEATLGIGSLRVWASPHNRVGSSSHFHARDDRLVGMWESRVLCEISKSLWKPFWGFHRDVISTAVWPFPLVRPVIRGDALPWPACRSSFLASPTRSFSIIGALRSRRRLISSRSVALSVVTVRRAQWGAPDGPDDRGSRRRPWGRPSSRATARAAVGS